MQFSTSTLFALLAALANSAIAAPTPGDGINILSERAPAFCPARFSDLIDKGLRPHYLKVQVITRSPNPPHQTFDGQYVKVFPNGQFGTTTDKNSARAGFMYQGNYRTVVGTGGTCKDMVDARYVNYENSDELWATVVQKDVVDDTDNLSSGGRYAMYPINGLKWENAPVIGGTSRPSPYKWAGWLVCEGNQGKKNGAQLFWKADRFTEDQRTLNCENVNLIPEYI